ncbi:MAG: hypothetical protein JWP97_3153 [Labilithrix sp.]|nr:hypothetical protein [Labilithrix sp.]
MRAAATITFALLALARTARADTPETPPPPPSDTPAEAPGSIDPEHPAGPGVDPAPGSPADPTTNETGKRIGVGVDALFVLPLAELGETTGPLGGPVLRFGYRVVPRLELALRAGYLFGIARRSAGADVRVDILPLWVGARFFAWRPFKGPYVALEGGMNSILPKISPPPTTRTAERFVELRRRFGGNVGAGWLFSEKLPIDVRVQVMVLNLIGRNEDLNEGLNVALSVGAGYTLQF